MKNVVSLIVIAASIAGIASAQKKVTKFKPGLKITKTTGKPKVLGIKKGKAHIVPKKG